MLVTEGRPNFFPGQMIDYRDFNRIAEQGEKATSLVNRHLYPGGGILPSALRGLEIATSKGLSLAVLPGVAVLPCGNVLISPTELSVNLGEYIGKNAKTVIVSLTGTRTGVDKYVDEKDSSISGFQSEVLAPKLTLSSRKPPKRALELFRVLLVPETKTFRRANKSEQWVEGEIRPKEGSTESVIDLRHRKELNVKSPRPEGAIGFIAMRKALYSMVSSHRALERIYFLKDELETRSLLNQLHSEVLGEPPQEQKMAFLLSEYAKSLGFYLERLGRRLGQQEGALDRDKLITLVGMLENMANDVLFPKGIEIEKVVAIANELESFVEFGKSKYDFASTVREGLLDLKAQHFALKPVVSIGGQVFSTVDKVEANDSSRYQVKAAESHKRRVIATFASGERHGDTGIFIPGGTFTYFLENIDPEKPLVILLKQYVRRTGGKLIFEINGKPLKEETSVDNLAENRWENLGLIIPSDCLVPQGNCFKVRVDETNLDYGFFSLVALQGEKKEKLSLQGGTSA